MYDLKHEMSARIQTNSCKKYRHQCKRKKKATVMGPLTCQFATFHVFFIDSSYHFVDFLVCSTNQQSAIKKEIYYLQSQIAQ